LREMISISVRIPKTYFRHKDEFTFNQIESGLGVVQQLEAWICSLEKRDDKAPIIMDAYLFPYEQAGGRVLLKKVLKKRVLLMPEKKLPVIEEKTLEKEIIVGKEVVEPSVEQAAVEETRKVVQKKVKKIDEAAAARSLEELRERRNKLTERINTELANPDSFFQSPIDFDYSKWNLWSTDGTRGVLRKVFLQNEIVTPNDLMKLLGTNDPTKQEWEDFIRILNINTNGSKISIGPNSQQSLLKWMRLHKVIPESFKKN